MNFYSQHSKLNCYRSYQRYLVVEILSLFYWTVIGYLHFSCTWELRRRIRMAVWLPLWLWSWCNTSLFFFIRVIVPHHVCLYFNSRTLFFSFLFLMVIHRSVRRRSGKWEMVRTCVEEDIDEKRQILKLMNLKKIWCLFEVN